MLVPTVTGKGGDERPWRRHELLRIAPDFWARMVASQPAIAAIPLLAGWADQGRPVIVRRRMDDDLPDMVPVGVPLPPTMGKWRVALTVPEEAILHHSRPPSLFSVEHAADPAWAPVIRALIALGARHGVWPAAFGGLLWQHQTGLPYLSSTSDIDVLWPIPGGCAIGSLLSGVAAAARKAPMRIDGEVVMPDGDAVGWREFHQALNPGNPAEVVVKSIRGVRLIPVSRLLATGAAP